jgi:hypothetical protein
MKLFESSRIYGNSGSKSVSCNYVVRCERDENVLATASFEKKGLSYVLERNKVEPEIRLNSSLWMVYGGDCCFNSGLDDSSTVGPDIGYDLCSV